MGPPASMAKEDDVDVDEQIDEQKGKKVAKHDSGSADLEKVTDYVEEEEISHQNIGDAMKAMSEKQSQDAAAKQQREKELSKVKITNEDVDLIVQEMEISRMAAERKLREHQGNVVATLIELTN